MNQGIPRQDTPTSVRDTLLNSIYKVNWPTLFAGVVVGVVSVHVAVVRPAIDRLARLERQAADVETGIRLLVETGDDADAATSLLASLSTQKAETDAARDSLASMEELRHSLRDEVERTFDAQASLEQIAALNTRLIEAEAMRTRTAAAIDEIESLQSEIADLAVTSEAASQQVAATETALDELTAVQNRLIAVRDNTELSANAAEKLISLQQQILSAEDLALSSENAEQLIALQNQLVVDERLQLEQAGRNIAELIVVQEMIADQTRQLADSIEGLELLTDFQDEMNGQLVGLESLRRQLTELVLLETTVARAMEALQPLASLQDLRRLDENEVRDVARLILERRREERTAAEDSKYDVPVPPEFDQTEIHRLVPEPPEEE